MKPAKLILILYYLSFIEPAYGAHKNTPGRPKLMKGKACVVFDFVRSFPEARVKFSSASSSNRREGPAAEKMPGIFLHPTVRPARAVFPAVSLPPLSEGEKLLLLGYAGFRDRVPWGKESPPVPNGVLFKIEASGETLVSEKRSGAGWRLFERDISHLSGKEVEFSLVTGALGNTNWDWAVFGNPLVCRLNRPEEEIPFADGKYSTNLSDRAPFLLHTDPNAKGKPAACLLGEDGIRPLPAHSAGKEPSAHRTLFVRKLPGPKKVTLGAGPLERWNLWFFSAGPVVEKAGLTCGLPVSGRKTQIYVKVKNKGYGPTEEGLKVRLKAKDMEIGSIPLPLLGPGKSQTVRSLPVTLPGSGDWRIEASIKKSKKTFSFSILPRGNPCARLKGETCELTFFSSNGPATYAQIRKRGSSSVIATIYPLATSALKKQELQPVRFDRVKEGGNSLELSASEGSVTYRQSWEVSKDVFRFQLKLIPGGRVKLFHLGGPAVLWGEGSQSEAHDFALLPGLEYLGSEDHSSSRLCARPPVQNHRVPHPLYLTSHMAAISRNDSVISLLWDYTQNWYKNRRFPLVYFDVPEKEADKNYSKMQLFVPSSLKGEMENRISAKEALEIREPVTLKGTLLCAHKSSPSLGKITEKERQGELVLRCLKRYLTQFDSVEAIEQPRSWLEEKRLSRTGWLKTVFVKGKGMRHAVGNRWKPAPTPGILTLLYLDGLETGGEEGRKVLERVKTMTDQAVSKRGPGYLSSGINCHILSGEYPFYAGHLAEGLGRAESVIRGVAGRLTASGGTPWFPGNSPSRKELGREGQVTSGNTARSAYRLAYYGRITGAQWAIEAACKATDRLEQFRIPRGAQGWECPLHSPDILAAAYAVRAYVDLYRITKEREYLDRARYWAWSGLPFVYSWGKSGIESMEGNTIPIFGATYYVHSWIGVPVVWCGLVYAYGLQQLSCVDGDPLWKQAALAITRSAMKQQYTDPKENQGCYPDSYNLKLNRRFPADIQPEGIMVNAWCLHGFDPAVKTEVINFQGRRLHISSGANIKELEAKDGALRVNLSFFPRRAVYLFIGRWEGEAKVRANGTAVSQVKELSGAPSGWSLLGEPQGLIVKASCDEKGKASLSIQKRN